MSAQSRPESLAFEKFSFLVLQNRSHFACCRLAAAEEKVLFFSVPPDPVLRR